MAAKDRIAAAAQINMFARWHTNMQPYLTDPLLGPRLKRHLDQFICCRALPVCPKQKHTDHEACGVCSNRPRLCAACDVA